MAGYSDPLYLESLAEFGEPIWLSKSGCGVLIEKIEGIKRFDARGPYPLLSCPNPQNLANELASELSHCVSLVAVLDPFYRIEATLKVRAFPDLCRPYKNHYIVDLSHYGGPHCSAHERKLRNSRVEVDWVEPGRKSLCDWKGLYKELTGRHSIFGIAAFSDRCFDLQWRLPGLHLCQANCGLEVVGMTLWLVDGDNAYYHLGASSELGYRLSASYSMFEVALHSLKEMGIKRVLLGSGAGAYGDPSDGLSRFKSGWANQVETAFLCGRIFDHAAYRSLAGNSKTSYFPAYREPNAKQLLVA